MNVTQNHIGAGMKKTALATATMGALLLFVGAAVPQVAHAQDRDDQHEYRERNNKGMEKCQRRIEKAEAKLTEEMRDHGNGSRKADRAWLDLRSERQRCYTAYHQWWDGRDQQWRMDRDWDRDPRNDRDDRDRDRGPGGPGSHLQWR